MSKKILGIMGSPRKNGNTHKLLEKILEGASEMGSSTEIVLLKKFNIKECNGCHTCWKGKDCSKKDDMNNIYSKIIESDVIIFGTPVYWYGPTALMKAFLDRFVFFNCPENREKIKDLKAIIVVPFEDEHLETANILVQMFEKSFQYLQIPLINKLLVPGVTKRGEVSKIKDIMDKCLDIGKSLI